jgi:hypothetical protein
MDVFIKKGNYLAKVFLGVKIENFYPQKTKTWEEREKMNFFLSPPTPSLLVTKKG